MLEKKKKFIPMHNTYDLLVGNLSIGIPSFRIRLRTRISLARPFRDLKSLLRSPNPYVLKVTVPVMDIAGLKS